MLAEFIPIGCGRMLTGSIPESGKGKAVELHHYLFDSLWKMGNQQIDAAILKPKIATKPAASDNDEEEKK